MDQSFKTKMLDISQIRTNPNNPRTIKDEKFKKLVKSIKENPEFLDARPIVVKDNVIYGGNMRWLALKEAGIEIKPEWIKDVTGWTDEAIRKFIVVDNIAYGDNDWDLLANQYEKEELEEWGMDVDKWVDDEVVEDEVPEMSTEEPKSKLGEIYQLGRHRVMCGDSTKIEDVERLMDGKKADMVFTDPPYSSGGSQESGKTSGSIGARGQKTIKNDNLSTRGYRLLMDDVLKLVSSCNSVFIFCDWKMWIETFDISERAGYRVRNMIVWDKMQMGMGMPFRNQHELCLFGSKIAGKIGNGNTPNVITCKRDREAEHATPKPVELISRMIKQVDNLNIYDPFIGSGSTLIACEQTNRICYGMEIDPKYVDVIRKRYAKFIGKEEEWEKVTPRILT